MPRYLIDTDILVDHEKGIRKSREFLAGLDRSENGLFLSVITLSELFAGLSAVDRKKSEPLISIFDLIVMDRLIAERAADYLWKYQKKSGVGLGDAVIAATAQELGAVLITRNFRHYPMSDIQVTVPY